MLKQPIVRPECCADHAAIADLIEKAFFGKPYADGDESELVDKLRQREALSVSLVAELDGKIIGQIAFSPAVASDGSERWYALGPLAVLPEYQGMGIGSQLVQRGLKAIAELNANGCILVGDLGYYGRFGFELSPSNVPHGEPPEHFMVKLFAGPLPQGSISFHEAFKTIAVIFES